MRIVGSGSYHFLYSSTGAIGSGVAAGGITGYKNSSGAVVSAQKVFVLATGSSSANSGSTSGYEYGFFGLYHNIMMFLHT